jgi:tetraacyldisaccharide 4'-kinase
MYRLAGWLWGERSLAARMVRLSLLPASLCYRGVAAARARAHARGWLRHRIPSVPTIAVGNLTVGGSGKTPIASWIAQYYTGRGIRPGVVLRGYGGDEGLVHQQRVPEAVVSEGIDRYAAAEAAVRRGAQVVILDDGYQRLDVGRDLNIAVVSAESGRAVRWTLPAGPWREPWSALRRADIVIVTRKRATLEAAQGVARRVRECAPSAGLAIVHLAISGFRTLRSGRAIDARVVDGAEILAGAGIADPGSLAAQCRALGARVRLLPLRDHHPYRDSDVRRLLHAVDALDYVVVTQKDAVKLQRRWPADAPEPLVALLDLEWEYGRPEFELALEAAADEITGLFAPEHHP